MQDFVRERWRMLRQLSQAGRSTVLIACAVLFIRALQPALTAIAVAALVQQIRDDHRAAEIIVRGVVPVAVLLLLGQGLTMYSDPLRVLVVRRINGAHRDRVARLASALTLTRLEDPDVQDALSAASADPDDWTQGTPGGAAWGQLWLMMRYFGALACAAILATTSALLALGLLAVTAFLHVLSSRYWLELPRAWAKCAPHVRRAEYWGTVLAGADDAKELRIFGFGPWASGRYRNETTAHLEPFHGVKISMIPRQWLPLLVSGCGLGAALYVLGDLAVGHHVTATILARDLTAVWGLIALGVVGGETLEIEGGRQPLVAGRRLSEDPRNRNGVARDLSLRPAEPIPARHMPPRIRFENVNYRYPDSPHDILHGLDLELIPGEVLALVGLNGAGKTTIAKLLTGLYEPTSGRVSADGVSIADLSEGDWHRQISVVFQDFIRFELSARDNVTLSHPGNEQETPLQRAAAAAGITRLIEQLPNGWDTALSREHQGGSDLSGGQWQRIAIARGLFALYSGATVLVLDEPTANLDAQTEFEIFHQLMHAAADASVLLISHRLATVREADRIAVLAGGRIYETGTHDQLMEIDGRYAELFRTQAAQFAEPAPGKGPRW